MRETMVSLHNHSIYSFSDGLIKPEELVQKAKEFNAPAVGISEHGNLCSMPDFIKSCEKAEIKPIIAIEFYMALDEVKGTQRGSNHIICIAKNEAGYKELLKLTQISNIPIKDGGSFFYRARITEKLLYANCKNLIVTTACIGGIIPELLLADKDDDAAILLDEMKYHIKDLYVEIQPHDDVKQEKANLKLIALAKKLDIPIVTCLDVHMKDMSYKDVYKLNSDLRRGVTISHSEEFKYYLYYKPMKEIYETLLAQGIDESVIDESIDNTIKIADMCDFKWENRSFDPPKFCDDAPAELYKLVSKGLVNKFGNKIPTAHKQRARHEYDVICKMGFANYFLILADAMEYCHKSNILVGPGRGSGASSLILWLLNITALDPLKYNLPFSRFLNEERIDTWPD